MEDLPVGRFVGSWVLIPDSCRYEQGEPPREARYEISVDGPEVVFRTTWIDAEGVSQQLEFRGPPDGSKLPIPGGELVDALAIHAVSPRELNSYGYRGEKELMVAQRQLDATGQAMRVTQLVRLPDGTAPANVSVYRRG